MTENSTDQNSDEETAPEEAEDPYDELELPDEEEDSVEEPDSFTQTQPVSESGSQDPEVPFDEAEEQIKKLGGNDAENA